jgi:hypothetical protein
VDDVARPEQLEELQELASMVTFATPLYRAENIEPQLWLDEYVAVIDAELC